MKRILLFPLLAVLALPLLAQDKAAQVADLQNQITAIDQSFVPMKDRMDALEKQNEDSKFTWGAYKKANDQYNADIAAFNVKMDAANRASQLLKPSIDNFDQRLASHNANQCVERNHDGSCGWYNNEAAQLEANRAQLNQAKAQVDAQFAALTPEAQRLDTTKAQLTTIYNQGMANDAKWRQGMDQLKSDYYGAVDKQNELKRKLAILQGSRDDCFKAIPPKCQTPQIGSDGKPVLDQDCERMVAQCRAAFDGSKP